MGKKSAEVPPLRLEYIDVAELDENPANWRTHPDKQLAALKDVIADVGWAGACLYNERTKRLIDGHARKKIAKGKVPVLIGDWSEEQERKILATLDPLAGMAEQNQEALESLLANMHVIGPTKEMLDDLLGKEADMPEKKELILNADLQHKILIDCRDEAHQAELLERFEREEITCKAMII